MQFLGKRKKTGEKSKRTGFTVPFIISIPFFHFNSRKMITYILVNILSLRRKTAIVVCGQDLLLFSSVQSPDFHRQYGIKNRGIFPNHPPFTHDELSA